MTLEDLKLQKRWVCWRREAVKGKETKVPYQPNGKHAMTNNHATWHTHAECAAVSPLVGVMLGNGIVGVDFDKCCDAFEGKFTPASREMVIAWPRFQADRNKRGRILFHILRAAPE